MNQPKNKKIEYTKIYLCYDHSGIILKEKIKQHFLNKYPDIELIDLQNISDLSIKIDYPDAAINLMNHLDLDDKNQLSIAICGTGIGMSIVLNKFYNVRCALVDNHHSAVLAKQHNNANIIALSARYNSIKKNLKLIDLFLNQTFIGDHHTKRIQKIEQISAKISKVFNHK